MAPLSLSGGVVPRVVVRLALVDVPKEPVEGAASPAELGVDGALGREEVTAGVVGVLAGITPALEPAVERSHVHLVGVVGVGEDKSGAGLEHGGELVEVVGVGQPDAPVTVPQ